MTRKMSCQGEADDAIARKIDAETTVPRTTNGTRRPTQSLRRPHGSWSAFGNRFANAWSHPRSAVVAPRRVA
jgi:hypothetical protein